jgi:hypothetical protein
MFRLFQMFRLCEVERHDAASFPGMDERPKPKHIVLLENNPLFLLWIAVRDRLTRAHTSRCAWQEV